MIKTTKGILVKPRKNGHEFSMPLPKSLGADVDTTYLLSKKRNGELICRPQKTRRNFFDDPRLNRDDFVKSMRACDLPFDQGHPIGREM